MPFLPWTECGLKVLYNNSEYLLSVGYVLSTVLIALHELVFVRTALWD